MKKILITGGCGFIGSHIALNLLLKGYKVIIIDSNINSSPHVIERIKKLTKISSSNLENNLEFVKGDIRDIDFIKKIFDVSIINKKSFDCVIHLAGLKSISESFRAPIEYWDTNVKGSINLLKQMAEYNCNSIIFSSSAGIYDFSNGKKLTENDPINPISPYAKSKDTVERILLDLFNIQNNEWRIANLRYFNPIGAHGSGLLGEDPQSRSNNIFPIILKVAGAKDKKLKIFGNCWPTHDKTCIRDYVHIEDIAIGHVRTLEYLLENDSKFINLNLGSGCGVSVLELIRTFERVNNINIDYEYVEERIGDVPSLIADNSLANSLLNWQPKKSLEDMCIDGWKWHTLNPRGYKN